MPPSPRRRLFRLVAVFAPLALLGLLELGLRVAGVGFPTRFFLPAGSTWLAPNPRFGWLVFPPSIARTPVVDLIPSPPADDLRIVVLGGSAAMGTPDPAYSFGRMLEVMLDAAGERDVRIVNAGMAAVSSHLLRLLAAELDDIDPDLVVVYAGHNEVVGPYGPGSILGGVAPAPRLVQLSLATRRTRVGQLLWGRRSSDEGRWRGMEMFVEHRIAADDPRLDGARRAFRANLESIARSIHRADAQVAFVTPVANLDSPPFGSTPPPEAVAADWQRLVGEGDDAAGAGRIEEAIGHFEQAEALFDEAADLHFRLGSAQVRTGRTEEGIGHLRRARELDLLRFRADQAMVDAVREAAAATGSLLVDAERALSEAPESPLGYPGAALFYEHVHLNVIGNYRLADAVRRGLAPWLREQGLDPEAESPIKRIAEHLGLTVDDRYAMDRTIFEMTGRPPFSAQLGHERSRRADRRRLAELAAAATRSVDDDETFLRAALVLRPDDVTLRARLARFLARHGRPDGAAELWSELHQLAPSLAPWTTGLAFAREASGAPEEALELLRSVTVTHGWSPGAWLNLGEMERAVGQRDEAKASLARALEIDPDYAPASLALGRLAEESEDPVGAEGIYRDLIARDPHLAEAHFRLASLLEQQGEDGEAEDAYRRALEEDPDHARARNNLGRMMGAAGQAREAAEAWTEAIGSDPLFALPRFNLADLLLASGNREAALQVYAEGLAIDPDNVPALYNFGGTLMLAGQPLGAIRAFEEVVARDPEHPGANHNLAWLLATGPAEARDAERALVFAERTVELTGGTAEALATLAVAQSAAGHREESKATAELALGAAAGDDQLRARIEARLAAISA